MIVAGRTTVSTQTGSVGAKRANSHTTEIAGASHSVYESHPKEVAAVIEEAAREVSK